jgi:hypothetical protein
VRARQEVFAPVVAWPLRVAWTLATIDALAPKDWSRLTMAEICVEVREEAWAMLAAPTSEIATAEPTIQRKSLGYI